MIWESVVSSPTRVASQRRNPDWFVVAALTEDLVYTIRGALNALPGRLAVDVAAVSTPAEASEVIRKEVSKVMRELAGNHYDPKKYEERVRERRDWSERDSDDE